MTDRKSYPFDLRENILHAYGRHRGSQRALAALFGVSRACVGQLLQRRRSTGQMAPVPHAGGRKPSCDQAALAVIRRVLPEHTDATWAELGARLGHSGASGVETGLRTAKARTREALDTALSQALATVTAVDAYN